MDNITHTLTGICLSRSGLNRFTPLATPILIIAANLPDVDIVSLAKGTTSYLHWHRNITHSIAAAPILAAAVAAAFRFFRPSLSVVGAFVVALCGIASHLLEDLTNVYGVRILLPFASTWFNWDLTPVVDFWIWTAFAIAMAAPVLSRLVGSEIGESKRVSSGRGFAIAALLFVVMYNGGRAVIHSRVLTTLNSREYSGTGPRRVAAFPASMNPLDWRGVAETDSDYQIFAFRPTAAFDPSLADTVSKAAPSLAIAEAAKTEPFQALAEFAQFPVYRTVPRAEPEGAVEVELSDLRFNFTSQALVTRAGHVERSQFQFGRAAAK